ncbi:signal peptidase I [Leucobacter chromiireducens]|uniref:Signal peptidase I n=1 Tax=Leucobacter chromiireducens subsp. solipictus TaxID=398235 RepID=A0ABS1SEK2_9MICO|nr:signal peptidase I [Leucobacter chromiireducens]MBL3677924.1 signal peptidase I [Leucobacter chromiireducens subsp. solipictus]
MSEAVSTAGERSRRGGFLGFVRDLLVILIVAFLVSFLLKTFLVRSFYIPSVSMEQTLQVNDRILVNQLVPDLVDVQRGDVVVFKDPGGWLYPRAESEPSGFEKVLQAVGLAADTSDEYVVKRVIGVGGDRVQCCDAEGRVMVNGVPLDEPYIVIPPGESRASKIDFDVTVPENAVWVMGDNRYQSKDSRYNQDQPGKGFVPEEEIVGRAFVLNWPLNRFTWLGTPEGTFTGVEQAREKQSSGA